ncbi:hypothetical protein ACEV60_18040 [Enterobacter ludwigii]|uniref:hypothetical protein n=1 Tax=Enterobacteriaceae TaxID=543 RepID=UPI00242BE3B2|nr:hypothetical protein [Enterobacter ludwigii]ELD3251746.1 hypothetical protein [Enterobacter hormaechei]WGA03918.1 hypothetical protein NFK84_19845 [Enterobacter ludwigii]HBC0589188.1 hypothetical protein [Enterobacter cloacae]
MLHIIIVFLLVQTGAGFVFWACVISCMEYTDPVLRELSHHPVAICVSLLLALNRI